MGWNACYVSYPLNSGISQLAPLNSLYEIIGKNFSSKTCLMVFKSANGIDWKAKREKAE